jgi:hypothetical protein
VGKCKVGKNFELLDVEEHDNFVDNDKKPTMYITPHEDAITIEYIVAFYQNAR